MINGLPEISIKYFSELASITYCLRLHNLFVNIVNTLEPKCTRVLDHFMKELTL